MTDKPDLIVADKITFKHISGLLRSKESLNKLDIALAQHIYLFLRSFKDDYSSILDKILGYSISNYKSEDIYTNNIHPFNVDVQWIAKGPQISNCFSFHVKRQTETTFKIISIQGDSSDFLAHIDRVKRSYSREERYVGRFPTKESWDKYIDDSMKIGGTLEVRDGTPQIYYLCDHESGIYSKYHEEANWCLISYDTINEVAKILEDFKDTNKILQGIPNFSLEIPELVEDYKLTFINFKQTEMKIKAFEYFLKNVTLPWKYNLKNEVIF